MLKAYVPSLILGGMMKKCCSNLPLNYELMNKYKFEIEYEYHPTPRDPESQPRLHWMYCDIKAKTIQEAAKKAKSYYENRITSLGWTRITTLREIRPPKRGNDPAPHKAVDPSTLPPARKSSGSNTKRGTGSSTRSRRASTDGRSKSSTRRKKPTG